jgi:hypothetical protein
MKRGSGSRSSKHTESERCTAKYMKLLTMHGTSIPVDLDELCMGASIGILDLMSR